MSSAKKIKEYMMLDTEDVSVSYDLSDIAIHPITITLYARVNSYYKWDVQFSAFCRGENMVTARAKNQTTDEAMIFFLSCEEKLLK